MTSLSVLPSGASAAYLWPNRHHDPGTSRPGYGPSHMGPSFHVRRRPARGPHGQLGRSRHRGDGQGRCRSLVIKIRAPDRQAESRATCWCPRWRHIRCLWWGRNTQSQPASRLLEVAVLRDPVLAYLNRQSPDQPQHTRLVGKIRATRVRRCDSSFRRCTVLVDLMCLRWDSGRR